MQPQSLIRVLLCVGLLLDLSCNAYGISVADGDAIVVMDSTDQETTTAAKDSIEREAMPAAMDSIEHEAMTAADSLSRAAKIIADSIARETAKAIADSIREMEEWEASWYVPDTTMEVEEEAADRRPAFVALKNNVLYDAIATPNLQVEFRLAPHWTLQAGVGFNPFPPDDRVFPKWRHISVELAPRYWLCEAFTKDFVSVNIGYAHYNVAGGKYPIGWMYKAVQTNRYQGDAIMFGASYGWHFALSHHFSIELEGGVDGGYTWFEQFKCVHCGKSLGMNRSWFVLPKLGVNLSVVLGGDKQDYTDRCDCERLHTTRTEEPAAEEPVPTTPEEPQEEPQEEPEAPKNIETVTPFWCDTCAHTSPAFVLDGMDNIEN